MSAHQDRDAIRGGAAMAAEGTACNGAGKAPEAEFAPVGEHEHEDVGGPFVIVNNGSSDGHSDRGSDSDLGKAPDEDSPSEEDDVPAPNAASEAAVGGDHGADEGEVGPPGAPLGALSADGSDRASDGSEGHEGEGESSSDCVAEVAQQESVGEEDGGAAALESGGCEPAIASADSEAPGVDSEVEGKEGAVDGSVVADISEAEGTAEASVEEEAKSMQVEGEATCGILECEEVGAAALESGGCEPAITSADSEEPGVDSEVEVKEGTVDESVVADIAEAEGTAEASVKEDSEVEGKEGTVDESVVADLAEAEGTAEASVEEEAPMQVEGEATCSILESEEVDKDGDEGLCDDCTVGVVFSNEETELTVKEITEEAVPNVNVSESEEVTTNTNQDTMQGGLAKDEVLIGIIQSDSYVESSLENKVKAEVDLVGEITAESDLKAEDMVKVKRAACEVDEPDVAFADEANQAPLHLQRDCESAMETIEHEKVDTPGGCQTDEIENSSELEPKKGFEMEVDDAIPLQEAAASVASVFHHEPRSIDLIENDSGNHSSSATVLESCDHLQTGESTSQEISVTTVEQPICSASLEHGRSIDLIENDSGNHYSPATVLESCDHVQTEDSTSQEISVTTVEQPICSASLEHGTMVVDEVEINSATGNVSNEKSSDVAVDQVEPVNLNVDELVVVDDDQPSSDPSCESARLDKPECISKKDDSSEIVEDSRSLENQSEICNAECSSRIANEGPSPVIMSNECSSRIANDGSPNDEAHLTEESCLSDKSCDSVDYENGNGIESAKSSDVIETSDKSCNTVGYENGNGIEPAKSSDVVETSDKSWNTVDYENGNGIEPAKSSDAVETKCLEAIVTEQKINGHQSSSEWHGDHAQVIGPQKIYIIKVPKFAGDDLWNKIQAAQAHLDQLTQERDAINRRRQKQKAVCDQYREKLDAARQEEREARTAHGDKKNDLNSVRSVLGKLHQANSVEELDELIAKKERTMQHETISLKEEKLLIKEINELKAQRKQLSATMGSKAEINEAFDQKDHIHERHKVLKKDSDVLFSTLKVLEENTRKIQKSFEDERTALRKLTEEHRAANEIRQKAYIEWTVLRSEPSKKNEFFFEYRDARNAAETFRANRDTNGLISHCNSQIERVMEMWNTNEDFRKQYVESNKVSTLKRLGTHDGRRLGPDEDPPVIPSRRPSNIYPLSASRPEVPTVASTPAPVLAAPAAIPAKEDSFPVLAAPQTSKRAKSKASGSSAQIENDSVIVSEAEDLKETLKEKARLLEEQLELTRKAEELARKEEELRKERDAAEKERLRLEQKAKAKEAEERKRRKAEKDKERAEFKARKEAEEKEKKKAKKDKKKGTPPADSSPIGESQAAALATADTDSNASDNAREVEVSQPAAPKRLSRPAAAIKQLNRLQPMPAPLRNRGRRKLRQYILIAAAVLSVLALFVAGNYIPRLKSVHS